MDTIRTRFLWSTRPGQSASWSAPAGAAIGAGDYFSRTTKKRDEVRSTRSLWNTQPGSASWSGPGSAGAAIGKYSSRPCYYKPLDQNIQFSRRVLASPPSAEDTDSEYKEIDTLTLYKNKYFQSGSSSSSFTDLCHQIGKSLFTDVYEEFNYLFPAILGSMTNIYTEENVRRTALISRLILLIIQFLAKTVPSHVNDGFKTPGIEPGNAGILDRAVNVTLGGLANWDGQYFLHVALKGYTHENTMAFFPLFPLTIGYLSKGFYLFVFPVLSLHSLILILGIIFNIWCFQNAAVALSELVQLRVGPNSKHILPTVIFLFCYNPASIFFSAFYSESLFAWLTFSCILQLYKKNFGHSIFYASLGAVCRSNGLLNFGLIGIAALADIVFEAPKVPEVAFIIAEPKYKRYVAALKRLVKVGVGCVIGVAPFLVFQVFCILRFCYDSRSSALPEFCLHNTLPYTYIQKANWNVGFLQYFELKQIPNFVLALPVLLTLAVGALRHAKNQRIELFGKLWKPKMDVYLDILELSLAWHGLFLSFFCLFFIHVQVSTRMIMSACPYIYIYIAEKMNDERWLYLNRLISWTPLTSFIQGWFSMYFLIGTIGFTLGYPWT